ncbi:hypothetical protein PR048_018286 [Dryococelus australis]|uniref:Uncharacterized protein n=1 Tax=Dryococelus australis TaxID=614101 RepID=A0ABQ9HC28_9NEOP|nr:hypothetical protein PR048_018286 [Dryococelus australis]
MLQKRGVWSKGHLNAALEAIAQGMKIALPFHAVLCKGIFRVTSIKNKICRRSLLTSEQENGLCSRIFHLADVGMPLTYKVLRLSVYIFCKQNKIRVPRDIDKTVYFVENCCCRHPGVVQRHCQIVNPWRGVKLNKYIMGNYFDTLCVFSNELDLMDKLKLIFNMDEKVTSRKQCFHDSKMKHYMQYICEMAGTFFKI